MKPDPEREEVVFVSIERIRRIVRPFAGLIHMKNFKDGLRISDKLGIRKFIFNLNSKIKITPRVSEETQKPHLISVFLGF